MNRKKSAGFGIVEIIVAMAIMITIATTVVSTVIYTFTVNRLGVEQTQATLFTQEGLEAVRSIRNQSWSNMTSGTHGLQNTGGSWQFSGTNNVQGKFTRQITLASVQRDGSSNIVASGGTIDTDTLVATATTTWNSSPTRLNSVSLTSYFTNFRKAICSWSTASLKGTFNKVSSIDATDVVVDGTYAYLVTKTQSGVDPEFFIIDVSNPLSPTLTGSLKISNDVNGIFVSGNYAYLATSGNTTELTIVDITNKSLPILAGVPLNLGGNQDATDIFVSGNYAYITKLNGSGSNRELYIVDISNPLLPTQTGTYESGNDVNAVFVSGNYAYLATSDNSKELEVVNITNKSAPTQAGTFNATGNANAISIFISGSTAYLGRISSADPEFFILNVTNPASISQIGSFDTGGGDVNEIQLSENNEALLATNTTNQQFISLDISTPSSPTLKSSLNLSDAAMGLAFSSTSCTTYVASSHNTQELQILQP